MSDVRCKTPDPPDPVFYQESEWTDGRDDVQAPGWYFWDETWSDHTGPFPDKKACREAVIAYAESL